MWKETAIGFYSPKIHHSRKVEPKWWSFWCFKRSLFLKKPLCPTLSQPETSHGYKLSLWALRKCCVRCFLVGKYLLSLGELDTRAASWLYKQPLWGQVRFIFRKLNGWASGESEESSISILWYPFRCCVRWSRRVKRNVSGQGHFAVKIPVWKEGVKRSIWVNGRFWCVYILSI